MRYFAYSSAVPRLNVCVLDVTIYSPLRSARLYPLGDNLCVMIQRRTFDGSDLTYGISRAELAP